MIIIIEIRLRHAIQCMSSGYWFKCYGVSGSYGSPFLEKGWTECFGGRVAYLFGDEKTNLSLLVDGCGSWVSPLRSCK